MVLTWAPEHTSVPRSESSAVGPPITPTGTTVGAHWSASSALPGPGTRGVETSMGIADKAQNKAEELGGKAKETAGQATDDNDLKNEGRGDQAKGNLKQVGEQAKDLFND